VSKGTTHRTVRIEDALWERAKAKADAEGVNLSAVIRDALRLYVEERHVKATDEATIAGYAHIAGCPECYERFGGFLRQ
jgi:metal-responsive CopG/Arc/MetJ family transcriptional regulator